jgi:predicted nucleotidyltransferase
LPGKCGAIRAHWSSLRTRRFKASSILEAMNQSYLASRLPQCANVNRP